MFYAILEYVKQYRRVVPILLLSDDQEAAYIPAVTTQTALYSLMGPAGEVEEEIQRRITASTRALLGLRGLNDLALIEPLRMAQSAISNRFRARTRWTIVDAVRLANFFEVGIEDILEPDRWRPKGPRGGSSLPRQDSNLEPAGYGRLKLRTAHWFEPALAEAS